MTDLTDSILPQLQSHRLPNLTLETDLDSIPLTDTEQKVAFQYPAYHGLSILNIPASLCQALAAPPLPDTAPALDPALRQRLPTASRVVFILMDALALHRLQRWIDDGTAPLWGQLARQGLLAPLTSITPSTTSAALTSLWTGRPALEHGITGYEMWLKEYGIVANTILHSPMSFRNDVGGLERAGFKPTEFMSLPTLGPHLKAHGIQPYALQHRNLLDSGLSRILFNGVETRAFHSAADLWVNLRQLLESGRDERMFIWIYWSEVDHFGHLYGPDDERVAAEFSLFTQAMQRYFLDRLSAAKQRDTLLILSADHGMIGTRPNHHFELARHPELVQRLHIQPTGENRLAFLYIKPGQVKAVSDYVTATWPDQFTILDSAHAVRQGLFGPGKPHLRLGDRIGDLLLAAKDGAFLWWAEKEDLMRGRHGGLHPEEMLVPFLATKLG